MSVKLVTAPTSEPVTVAEAKAQCRVDISTEDTYIGTLITAAREYCELYDWRVYMPQTWDLYLDNWPLRNSIALPKAPLQSVTSVTYTDIDGNAATLSSSEYLVDTASVPGWLVLKSAYNWPSVALQDINGIVIRFVAGYADANDVPARIKQAMLLLIGHWYENRETVVVGAVGREIEFAVKSLLNIDRVKRY